MLGEAVLSVSVSPEDVISSFGTFIKSPLHDGQNLIFGRDLLGIIPPVCIYTCNNNSLLCLCKQIKPGIT
jgi:hypothetical protein